MNETASANPVLAEVWRGSMVESLHRGAAVIAYADGRIEAAWGDIDQPVFPRSAVKPLQAIALVESGAADAFDVNDRELALACASHNGEPVHVETAAAWLERLGLTPGDLECGSHWPLDEEAARALAAGGGTPDGLHNNCSGKHSGFLTLARHRGWPTAGYVQAEHPVQQTITALLADMYGLDLEAAPLGIDGCSIPTWGVPLENMALAMARFAAADGLAPTRAAAVRRIAQAMARHPYLVAGRGRFNTALLEACAGRVIAKVGAEGSYIAALPGRGIGIAVKCDDGAKRAAQVVMTALLSRTGALDDTARHRLAAAHPPALYNANRIETGEIRPAEEMA